MISRRAAYSIVLGIAAVLIVTWRMGHFPARVVLINQSGTTLAQVVVDTDSERIELGSLVNGETRRMTIDPTDALRLTFRTTKNRAWNASEPLTAGQSLVLYVTAGDRVVPRRPSDWPASLQK
jgi:hypothetical protein